MIVLCRTLSVYLFYMDILTILVHSHLMDKLEKMVNLAQMGILLMVIHLKSMDK